LNATPALPGLQRANELVLVAAFAALIVALGAIYIPVPASPVPVTGQTLGVLLAANVLGARRGTTAVALVLMLAFIGMPVLAGGRGGAAVFVSASGGYLFGMLLAAAAVGMLTERLGPDRVGLAVRIVVNTTVGVFAVYLIGVPWLAFVTDRPPWEALTAGMFPFLPGDLLKAVVAALGGHAVIQPLARANFASLRR
jgi:biotin transport system substrate-specific component